MVALLGMCAIVAISNAQNGPGLPSSSPVMQGAVPQALDPVGKFTDRWHHRPLLEAIQRKLGISDEQEKQMRALYVGFKDRTRKTRMELFFLRDAKKTMVLSGKIDQAKLAQIGDQIVKLVSDVLRENLKLRRDRLALMTPEQLGRIATWQAEKGVGSKMMRMHGEHRGMRHEVGF